jgi:hypothetical protein
MDLYIYYRVACEREQQLRDRASAMQSLLSKRHGVAAELKRRPDAKNGQHTWMEVYRAVPPEFDAILTHAVAEAGLQALIDGERHTEVFMDVSSCA